MWQGGAVKDYDDSESEGDGGDNDDDDDDHDDHDDNNDPNRQKIESYGWRTHAVEEKMSPLRTQPKSAGDGDDDAPCTSDDDDI